MEVSYWKKEKNKYHVGFFSAFTLLLFLMLLWVPPGISATSFWRTQTNSPPCSFMSNRNQLAPQYISTTCLCCRTAAVLTPLFLPCRVQGGFLLIWQGWRWNHHHQRAGHRHEVAGPEPYRGRAAGYDQRGGCWRSVCLVSAGGHLCLITVQRAGTEL